MYCRCFESKAGFLGQLEGEYPTPCRRRGVSGRERSDVLRMRGTGVGVRGGW